jgi:hypothetical protein
MEPIYLQWSYCIDGYSLQPKGGLVATSQRFQQYEPLKVPALFVQFADAKANPEGMRAFCSKFGLPTGQGARYVSARGVVSRRYSVHVDVLLDHQAAMRRALNRFKLGDVSDLITYCNWEARLTALSIQLRRNPDGRLSMILTPPDLLRAMWFQFAQHACSGTHLFRCDWCNNPFVVGTGTKRRSTAKYCSRTCKQAASNASKKRTTR